MCGKNDEFQTSERFYAGSPPRVREKLIYSQKENATHGITPACAGKTLQVLLSGNLAWDHPRVCGKNCWKQEDLSDSLGSPPRVREKRQT